MIGTDPPLAWIPLCADLCVDLSSPHSSGAGDGSAFLGVAPQQQERASPGDGGIPLYVSNSRCVTWSVEFSEMDEE